MAAQYFTVVKIAGAAAAAANSLLLAWQRARLVDFSDEWTADQWPAIAREEIDGFADRLRRHGHAPPLVFLVEFVDLWSSAPHFVYPLPVVLGNEYEVCFVETPFLSELKQQLGEREKYGQNNEDQFFAKVLLEADRAWSELVGDALIVILRRVIGGLVTDEEIEASLKVVPAWIRSADVAEARA
jgi:hypothetical protein